MSEVKSFAALVEAEMWEAVKSATNKGEVKTRVVAALVEKKLARRTELMSSALNLQARLTKELESLKPGKVGVDADTGEAVTSNVLADWQYNRKKVLVKNLATLDTILTAQDFDKMSDVLRNGFPNCCEEDNDDCCE
jgi:hypothetical protein